jgi:hypothetical protein
MVKEAPPEELGKLLKGYISSDSPVMWALSRVVLQANELARGLATIDFTTDEGRLRAIRQQGTIEGLLMAVEIALRPAQEEGDGREQQ